MPNFVGKLPSSLRGKLTLFSKTVGLVIIFKTSPFTVVRKVIPSSVREKIIQSSLNVFFSKLQLEPVSKNLSMQLERMP